MNIFGAFTFGSIIKTFLPGFVWIFVLLLAEVFLSKWTEQASTILPYLSKDYFNTLVVLAIPLAFVLGLISNIIVFMGINDILVRNPVQKKYPQLFQLKRAIDEKLITSYSDSIGFDCKVDRTNFANIADPEIMTLPKTGVDVISYTREQYWFHLEFQLNLVLPLGILFLLSVAYQLAIDSGINTYLFVIWVVQVILCITLLNAAKKNYKRHIEKIVSLMGGVLRVINEEPNP